MLANEFTCEYSQLEQNRLDELKVTEDSAVWMAQEVFRPGEEPFIWNPSYPKSLSKRTASAILPACDEQDESVQPRITAEHSAPVRPEADDGDSSSRRQTRSMSRAVNSVESDRSCFENGWFDLAADIPWSEPDTSRSAEWTLNDDPRGLNFTSIRILFIILSVVYFG